MNRCKNCQLFLTINLEGRGLLGGVNGGGGGVLSAVVFCFKIAESILTLRIARVTPFFSQLRSGGAGIYSQSYVCVRTRSGGSRLCWSN